MMRSKLIAAILVSAALAVGTAFAQPGQESGDSKGGVKGTENFVTVTHYMMGDAPQAGMAETFNRVQAKWNELLKSKINANMDIKWIEWADWYTKYNLLLASGEPLDLVESSSTWLDLWPNAGRSAWKVLDDLLPVYAPKTWKEITPAEWDQCRYDGKIIVLPENAYSQFVNHGMFYRGDWAKEFGIQLPIKDIETLAKYWQGVKDKKPGVVPWDVPGNDAGRFFSGWVVSKTDAVDSRIGTGGQVQMFWTKNYDEKYTLWNPVFEPIFVEYAKKMKEFGDAGYWRKDVLAYTGASNTQMEAGLSGSHQHHSNTYRGWYMNFEDKNPGANLQHFAFSDTRNNLIAEPITHGAMSIGANSKNPERALMVYELLRQDKEFYQLVNYGELNKDYVVTKDGKRDNPPAPWSFDKNRYGINYWGGRVDKFEIPTVRDYSGIWDIWKRYKSIAKPYPYSSFIFDKTPVEAELAAISEVGNKYGPAIMLGKAGDPVAAVEEFRAKLKSAGYDKVAAEIQKQLTGYKTLIEKK